MNSFLIYQNKKIFVRVAGAGSPVLLIHGFGEDGNIWNEIIDHLKDRYQLIVPDLPGSGQSEMIDDMSMEGMAELMKFITASPYPSEGGSLDPRKLNRTPAITDSEAPPSGGFRGAVIGHSMGGYIALAFAEKYPRAFSALGLFHSTAYADSEEKKATRRKGIDFILENGAHPFLKTAIPNLFSPASKERIPGQIQKFIDDQHNFSPEALVSYYEAMIRRPDRTAVLRNSPVPVLFIMGIYDNAIPLPDVLEQCHLPGKSYIHILRKSGHMGMMEEPGACLRILDKFLLEI